MAKQKQEPKEIECKNCNHSTLLSNELYCKTMLKDNKDKSNYAKVNKKIDCPYFKNKFSLV